MILLRISSQPTLEFLVVVNPDSGPGAANTQPDTNYQSCIAQLFTTGATHSNVKILGYVSTGFGSRTSSAVTTDIDTYSQWSAAYRPQGIFFDEGATAARFLADYQTWSAKAMADFGSTGYVSVLLKISVETGLLRSFTDRDQSWCRSRDNWIFQYRQSHRHVRRFL